MIHIKKGGKLKIAELLPLKVYTLSNYGNCIACQSWLISEFVQCSIIKPTLTGFEETSIYCPVQFFSLFSLVNIPYWARLFKTNDIVS